METEYSDLIKAYAFDDEANAITIPLAQALPTCLQVQYPRLQQRPRNALHSEKVWSELSKCVRCLSLAARAEAEAEERGGRANEGLRGCVTEAVEDFVGSLRVACNSLSMSLSDLPMWPRGAASRSFRTFKNGWCWRTRGADPLATHVATRTAWFDVVRDLRDSLEHKGCEMIVLHGAKTGFRFRLLEGPPSGLRPTRAVEFMGKTIVDFLLLSEAMRRRVAEPFLAQHGIQCPSRAAIVLWWGNEHLIPYMREAGAAEFTFPRDGLKPSKTPLFEPGTFIIANRQLDFGV